MTSPADDSARRIVVGVDGSDSSVVALTWAADQATLTGSTLVAVMSWGVAELIRERLLSS